MCRGGVHKTKEKNAVVVVSLQPAICCCQFAPRGSRPEWSIHPSLRARGSRVKGIGSFQEKKSQSCLDPFSISVDLYLHHSAHALQKFANQRKSNLESRRLQREKK